jgi:predicted phosphodiesterase
LLTIYINMSLEIQIVSDTHCEFWLEKSKFNFIKPTAKILALLGDICCCGADDDFEVYKRFITELLPNYDHILIISGNHEYYFNPSTKGVKPTKENTIEGIDERIKTFTKTSPKLHYLNNSSIKLASGKKEYLICGTTLWSYIPPEHQTTITKEMNDYKYIYVTDAKNKRIRSLQASDVTEMFQKNIKYIKSQRVRAKKNKIPLILLTHHKPFISESYGKNLYDCAYESDAQVLIKDPIILTAYGHTHVAYDGQVNKIRTVSNPKGYRGQKTNYNAEFKVKI